MKRKLREFRQKKGISITFIAKSLGYKHPSGYSNIENGPNKLSLENAIKLAEIFQITVDELLEMLDEDGHFFTQKLHKTCKTSA